MVAYFFPPIAASGSMRSLGFCRYLEKYGWNARVLTTDQRSVYPPTGLDESLRRRLPENLRIDSVPHWNPEQSLLRFRNKLRRAARKCLRSKVNKAPEMASVYPAAATGGIFSEQFVSLKNSILERMFAFPDPQCAWLRPAVRRLTRISRNEYPDVVYATGGPWTGLLVGKTLAQRFQVPLVVDLRDPWTCNPYLRFSSPRSLDKAKRLERSVYEAAAHIIANTVELCAKLQNDHPDLENKITTISNGFDTETQIPGDDANNEELRISALSCQGLELCHFGSVYGERTPHLLLRAVKELVDEKQVKPDRLRLRFVGAWDVTEPACEELARELEISGILRRETRVPHDECLKQMRSANVLLVIQPASELQVPAKIFDYVATERPILVIGGEGATGHLLENHQLGVSCPNEVAAIKKMLSRLVTGQAEIAPPRKEALTSFRYRNLTGKLASVLDTVYAGNS